MAGIFLCREIAFEFVCGTLYIYRTIVYYCRCICTCVSNFCFFALVLAEFRMSVPGLIWMSIEYSCGRELLAAEFPGLAILGGPERTNDQREFIVLFF